MPEAETDATPAPVIENAPVEVSDGVFVIPDGGVPLVPNVGIVRGSRAVLVVDAGMGPRNGEIVRRHAEELAPGLPLFLTVTHFHPEHGFGAQVFEREATIVYNREQADELMEKGPGYVEMFRGFGEGVAAQLEGVELVAPHVVYEGSSSVDLGGVTVELSHHGLAHTKGDQLVLVREQGVLFTGDLVETRLFPIFPWFPPQDTNVSGRGWISVLEVIDHLDASIVVPGHGEVGGRELAAAVLEYILDVQQRVRDAGDAGSVEELKAELEPQLRERYDWDAPEWIGFAIECFYTELHG